MSEFPHPNRIFLPLLGSEYQQPALVTAGFDSVTEGNDEYIVLTRPDRAKGEVREYFQLPNDPKTVRELMVVIRDGLRTGWGPFDGWMPE